LEKLSEINCLLKICQEAKTSGKITGSQLTQLYNTFGSRFTKAWEALNEGRVKKYLFKPSHKVIWIVVGKERDYLIMPEAGFCTCDDYYFRVMDKQIHLCYHLIAQKIAEALNWYEFIEDYDDLYETLMEEWRKVSP
jgi:predicted nucleic acid-binding Zn finger protein